MTRSMHKAGLIVAAAIPAFILPSRISEGQLSDPVNLIGSEIVIFLMCLTCWYCIHYLQSKFTLYIGLALSVLCCCLLSNLFFFTFNPIFKDFPYRTPSNSMVIKILMLSSRGILMSVILVPAAYYVKRDQEAKRQREENQRLINERFEIENRMLEEAVMERTQALHETLNSLEQSQLELEHQLFVQSRLVASITHDVQGPFKYLLLLTDRVNQLASLGAYEQVGEYTRQLYSQLESMDGFVKQLLDFAKLPVQQKLSKFEEVDLSDIVRRKQQLFTGMVGARSNKLIIETSEFLPVATNPSLLRIVLHNLIDNANKHTSRGEIKLTANHDGEFAKLTIENTGSAIPAPIIEWMNSDTPQNTVGFISRPDITPGIGLILVKEIAKLLDITLWIESDAQVSRVSLMFTSKVQAGLLHA